MPTRRSGATPSSPRTVGSLALAITAPDLATPHVPTAILLALIVSARQAARLRGG